MRYRYLLLFFLFSLFLSCELLFDYNLFDKWDQADIPSASDLRNLGDEALDFLDENLNSDDFIENLNSDQAAKDEILNFLEEDYLSEEPNDENRENYQKAAILYGKIEMSTGPADDISDSLVDAVLNGEKDIDVADLFPEDLSESEFDSALDSLLSSAEAFTKLGESLQDEDNDGDLDTAGEVNLGEVVQDAAVAVFVKTVYDSIPGSEEEKREGLKNYITADGENPVPEDVDVAETAGNNQALNNIFEAADFTVEF